jgi:hypothetical protein
VQTDANKPRCVWTSKPRLAELRLAKQGVPEQGVNIDQSRQDRDFSCHAPISLRLTAFDCSRLQLAAGGVQVGCSWGAGSVHVGLGGSVPPDPVKVFQHVNL